MKKKRILIIDDEPNILRVARKRLESNGYEIMVASSGEEGITVAFSDEPDLIFLDLVMPGIDGYEVCRRLKADGLTKDIPIIIFTASAEPEDFTQKSKETGAVGVLVKPFRSEELLSIAASYLK